MTSMHRQHSSLQRVNRAYVDVPPSPLIKHRHISGSGLHPVLNSIEQKENTPWKLCSPSMSRSDTTSTSLKRKILDSESLPLEGATLHPKKSKLSYGAPLNVKQALTNGPAKTLSEEFPSGLVYCHQCNKKRDLNDVIVCNASLCITNSDNSKKRACKYRYCTKCLKNRYNEDMNTLRLEDLNSGFKCPRCRDICNCPRCRKAKGLEPVGVIGEPKSTKDKKPKLKTTDITKETERNAFTEMAASEVQKPLQKLELPELKWSQVSTRLTLDEVCERIFIREFLFRFGDVLDPPVAKSHLEDLELIGGRVRKSGDDNDDAPSGWATDLCVKAIVIGLLGVFLQNHEGDTGNVIKATIRDLRSGGLNLNKIWISLQTLRAALAQVTPNVKFLDFCDPLPSSTTTRKLRNVRVSTGVVNIVHSAQMIPVIISLIHSALETKIIREELDLGFKDNKDYSRDAREAMKIENERWEQERKEIDAGTKDKAQKAERRAKLSAHRAQTANIENALKMVGSSFAPRFTALGTDDDGRIYYALSPGIAEREAAFEYLEVAASEKVTALKKKRCVLSDDEREEMRDWCWFVAVWGTRPFPLQEAKSTSIEEPMVDDAKSSGDETEDEDMENIPRWWGFWDVEEITKLAEWVSIKHGLKGGEGLTEGVSVSTSSMASTSSFRQKHPRTNQLKKLVDHLKEYAAVLRWRINPDRYTLIGRASR